MTIAENLNRIEQAKADIKTAIESKGVYVDEADRIDVYASKIYEIEQGGGTGVIDIIDAGQLFDMIMNQGYAGPVVLKGTITGIDEISPEYNNATYYVDGAIKVYRGNYLEGMSFVNGDELKIGDYVVVRGTASNYNGTPQIDKYSVIEVLRSEPLIGSLKVTPITTNGEETLFAADKGLDAWNVVTVRTRVQNPFYTVSQAIEYGATDRPYPSGDYIFVTGRVSEITSINGNRYSFIITDENNTMTITNSTLVNDISEVQVNDYVVVRGLLDKTGTKIQSSPTLFLKYSNAGGGGTGGGDTGVINMADRGLRFFHFNGENLDGYDFSTVTDFTRFFARMPQLRSDLNVRFNAGQTMDYMFEFVASDIEEGIEINIDFNNQSCFNFTHIFNGSRLKRFPRFTNMNDETWIENFRPFGNCHIHNFDNWQEFPWNRIRGEGGNNLFASMSNLVEVPDIDLSNVEVANGMFGDCYNLERVGSLNFQNIGAFSSVFSNCSKLTYIGDLGNFENCWQFDNPFEGCPNLITLPRMHNLKRSLNLSNMVQMDAGTAGLFLKYDVYNFAENGVERQDGEGVLTVPAYFNDNEFWLVHRDGIIDRGWTIEYV